jgi:hypothetical protein
VVHHYGRLIGVIEKEKDGSRNKKEPQVKGWDVDLDVGLVVFRSICPKM